MCLCVLCALAHLPFCASATFSISYTLYNAIHTIRLLVLSVIGGGRRAGIVRRRGARWHAHATALLEYLNSMWGDKHGDVLFKSLDFWCKVRP